MLRYDSLLFAYVVLYFCTFILLISGSIIQTNYPCRCSICLGDYKANDRLQQIPMCGHTFHMDCINHWLTNNTTCPLCRVSLLPASKAASDPVGTQEAQANETESRELTEQSGDGLLLRDQEGGRGEGRESCSGGEGHEFCDASREVEQCGLNGEGSVVINIEDHRVLRSL